MQYPYHVSTDAATITFTHGGGGGGDDDDDDERLDALFCSSPDAS